jgi:hypothetical protein
MDIRKSRTAPLACAVIALGALAADAGAVVTGSAMPRPANSYVGKWNGSSAVAIGPNWIVTARHNGGNLNTKFKLNGVYYTTSAIFSHASADIAVVRLNEDLPGWHAITNVAAAQLVVVGGMGRVAGESLRDGYWWSGPNAETWGANRVDWAAGDFIAFDWDLSGTGPGVMTGAVAHEAAFALNDSGGGVFVQQANGSFAVAGIAIGVSEANLTRHGSWSYALNLNSYLSWMQNVAGVPVVTVPSGPGVAVPAPGGVALLSIAVCLAARRRR